MSSLPQYDQKLKQIFWPDVPQIRISVRRSKQARRLSLRVSRLHRTVTITGPHYADIGQFVGFVAQKRDWIIGHFDNLPAPTSVEVGQDLPFLGQIRTIHHGNTRRVTVTDTGVYLPKSTGHPGRKIQAFLKVQAREKLAQASDNYSKKLGIPYTRLTLRDTKSRWGSCSSQGHLMYSWRLIMAPPDVLDYVAAHEVSHLAEMNHSAKFWAVVDRLYGDHQAQRQWLRTEGVKLHHYHFDD